MITRAKVQAWTERNWNRKASVSPLFANLAKHHLRYENPNELLKPKLCQSISGSANDQNDFPWIIVFPVRCLVG